MASNDIVFSQPSLMSSSFSTFYEMKRNAELSDFTIKIENRTLSVHRIILAAAIPYFRAMFTSNLAESSAKEVTMEELDPTALESLIDFAYTSQVKITIHNVQPLLIASEFLQLTQVRDSCCDFLSKRLDPKCVMNVPALADRLNCLSSVKKVDGYIRKNFDSFCQTKDFPGLSFSVLNELIRKDDLIVSSEEKVFHAVMRWVKTDSKRHKLLPELLTGVRMTYLTPEFLTKKASKEKLIMDSMHCRNLLDEAKQYHLLPEEGASSCSFTVSERCCSGRGIYLFCCNKICGLIIFRYITATGKWKTVLNDRERSDLKYVLAVGDKIYVFRRNNFEIFNPRTMTWTPKAMFPSMFRNFNHIVASNNKIYWLGNSQNSCEGICFNNEANQWNRYLHRNLNLNFYEDVLVCGDNIYVFRSSYRRGQGAILIKYDLHRKKVSHLPLQRETGSAFGSAVLGDSIYLCGGISDPKLFNMWEINPRNSERVLTRTEIYRPSRGWRTASQMNIPRKNFSLLTYEKKLYAVGGTTDPNYFEVYDPPADKWTVLGGRVEEGLYDFVKAVAICDERN